MKIAFEAARRGISVLELFLDAILKTHETLSNNNPKVRRQDTFSHAIAQVLGSRFRGHLKGFFRVLGTKHSVLESR